MDFVGPTNSAKSVEFLWNFCRIPRNLTLFKSQRPIVRAACDLLPVGTFRRPPLFKCGDEVQFAAPDRRIRLRTFGTITSVVYDGAVPQYVVTTASTLSRQYTVLEDRLERAAAVDPDFALRDSELVLRGASAATTDLTDHPRVVLTLDVVDENITADDFEGAEEGVDETSVDDVTDELALAQDTVMATFEARLLAHNAEIEARLRAQYDKMLATQSDAHSRVLLAMEAQRIDFDKAVNTPAVALAPTASASTAQVNTRLSDPNAAAYVTPAPRDVPMQEIMSSPLQALRAGTLAMAETQRRTSFARVFDLNSSGSTAAASPPENVDLRSEPRSSTKESAKNDEASINEYYARAQLANAKLIRSYKTRIEALKQSTITYYINNAMLAGGKAIGFSVRRLSWAEIGFLILLARMLLPAISPHLRPIQLAFARMITDRWLAWRRSMMATVRAAALTTVTGIAARLASADSTSVADAPAMAGTPTMDDAWNSSVAGPTVPPPLPASAAMPDKPDMGTSKVVMPVGNISAAVLPVGLANHGTALCDDGATIDCFVTLDGVIPGTFDGSQGGPLTIGDKSASLASEGVYLYAIERCGADGSCQDELFSGHHTPNGVANILSESREVNVRQSRIEWCPGMARQIHTKYGDTLPLIMGSNGLGFLTIRAITDRARIVRLLQRSTLTPQLASLIANGAISYDVQRCTTSTACYVDGAFDHFGTVAHR